MDIASLLLNVKAEVNMSNLLWQDTILTEQDKETYNAKGYIVYFTKDEFEAIFKIPSSCVCYTTSISEHSIYFNRETLAASCFPMMMLVEDGKPKQGQFGVDNFYQSIAHVEEDVKNGNFVGALLALPDSLRIDYFNLLVEKANKGLVKVDDLYELFLGIYLMSDYGFSSLKAETFDKIVASKTEEQRQATADALKDFPDIVTIYRGCTEEISTPEDKAHSWTLDINTANFFASRLGKDDSEIIIATIEKDKIIEYLDNGESEVWVDYLDINLKDRWKIHGLKYLEENLPKITTQYLYYKDYLNDIPFTVESNVHGRLHTLRVLLWVLMLSEQLNLPQEDRRILATAALYHDTGRMHDGEDNEHGAKSVQIYEDTEGQIEDSVSFLIKYHCLPDEEGFKEIEENPKLSCDAERNRVRLRVFKDADGLDRVRLGLREIDLTQLRLPISKKLVKAARICLEQVK